MTRGESFSTRFGTILRRSAMPLSIHRVVGYLLSPPPPFLCHFPPNWRVSVGAASNLCYRQKIESLAIIINSNEHPIVGTVCGAECQHTGAGGGRIREEKRKGGKSQRSKRRCLRRFLGDERTPKSQGSVVVIRRHLGTVEHSQQFLKSLCE